MVYGGESPSDADAGRVLTSSANCLAARFFNAPIANARARYVNLTVCGCTNAAQCTQQVPECAGPSAQEFEVCCNMPLVVCVVLCC
jgi:hypothetical protein